ncbi:hypothetical protein PHBOTO_000400 [Pseudozyma hubeiensis]|nr:hypothetical protein PHBOTO_000400 [Pseudozyma hubeiensis]
MFFDNIGIDLHFVYEAEAYSADAGRAFSAFHNAAQCSTNDGKTWVGAFLLNEQMRELSKYKSPRGVPAETVDPAQTEHIVIESVHHHNQTRYFARIWRSPTVLKNSEARDEADVVAMRVLERCLPGQEPAVLFESRPYLFHSWQTSIWIDAGIIDQLPPSDISFRVERPSVKKTMTANFKYQPSTESLARFPGVPALPSSQVDPRVVKEGTQDGRELRQAVQAYLESRRPLGAGLAPTFVPAQTLPSPSFGNNQTNSSSPVAPSAKIVPNSFQTLLATSDKASVSLPSTQSASVVADSLFSTQPSQSPQRSPPLISRAWDALTTAASCIAPGITSSAASSAASITAERTEHDRDALKGDNEPCDSHAERPAQGSGEEDDSPSDGGAQLAAQINELVNEICNTIRDADDNEGSSPWQDVPRVDKSTQSEERSHILDVSHNNGSKAPVCESARGSASLVVPGGSNAPLTSLEDKRDSLDNGAQSIANDNVPPSAPGGSADDVEMVDATRDTTQASEAIFGSHSNGTTNSTARATGMQGNSAIHSNAAFVSTSHAAPAAGSQAATAEATGDDDIQFVSSSQAVRADQVGAIPSSADSDAPLAQLRTTPAPGSVNGSMVLAPPARSRLGSISRASGSMRTRRAGSRSIGSPAPSTRSRRSEFVPGTQRYNQALEYLMDMVSNDKLKDDQRCLALAEQRAKDTEIYERARHQYEEEITANNLQMQTARAAVELKRDTIRLLRGQYRSEIGDARFRAKIGEAIRSGNERRGRSRSRSASASVAGRQMTGPPSIVPASRIKRERIDLTADGEADLSTVNANTRAGSVAPSSHGSRSQASAMKVGDISDLMRPPSVAPKRSASVFGGYAGSSAGTAISARPRSAPGNVAGQINGWIKAAQRSRAASRAPTPAPDSMQSNRVPFASRGNAVTPIEVFDDDAPSTGAGGNSQRRQLTSRAPSIASQRSRHSKRSSGRQIREGSIAAAAIPVAEDDDQTVVSDSDSGDENEEPLFLGERQRRHASVATSRFSELLGP